MFLFAMTVYHLQSRLSEIKGMNRVSLRRKSSSAGVHAALTTYESNGQRSWDDFEQFLVEYQKANSWYTAFSLVIQLFTLLGILGTVAGLYIAMHNGQELYQGVEFALSSTVYGIIAAVFYKVLDIIVSAVLITPIDENVERFEKSFQIDRDDAHWNLSESRESEEAEE